MTDEKFNECKAKCEEFAKSSIQNIYQDVIAFSEQWCKVGNLLAIVTKEYEEVCKKLKKEEALAFVKYKSLESKPSDSLAKNMVIADESLEELRQMEITNNYRVNCIRGIYEALLAKRQFLMKFADQVISDRKSETFN